VTVFGSNSRCGALILVCNQPPTSTQPGRPFVGRRNEYQPKGGDALRLGSKGRYVCEWQVKLSDPLVTHGPYMNALEMHHDKVLYKFTLFYFTPQQTFGISKTFSVVAALLCVADWPMHGEFHLRVELRLEYDVVDFFERASTQSNAVPLYDLITWIINTTTTTYGLAPSYLSRDLLRVSDLAARQRLRSSSSSTLVVSPTRLSTAGDCAFPVAAARTWNSLSRSLASLSSLASFRRQLKTELFTRSFPDLDSSAYDLI